MKLYIRLQLQQLGNQSAYLCAFFDQVSAFAADYGSDVDAFLRQAEATKRTFSIVLGALATATAPASTIMTIRQTGAKGDFVETLLQVVALDDVQSETAHENQVQRVGIVLREQIRQVHQHVGIGCQVVELVILVELVETALRLPSIHVQAQSDGGEEIASNRETGSGIEQFVDFRIGRCELQATLCQATFIHTQTNRNPTTRFG